MSGIIKSDKTAIRSKVMITIHKCLRCKNFLDGDLRNLTAKCKAFPDGIPEMKIAFISRDECVDCNNGIGFENRLSEQKGGSE